MHRFADVRVVSEVKEIDQLTMPRQFEFRHSVIVGVKQVGPKEAVDQLYGQARRAIARELYGEVLDDLCELERLLYEEAYRPADDPILTKIRSIKEDIWDWK